MRPTKAPNPTARFQQRPKPNPMARAVQNKPRPGGPPSPRNGNTPLYALQPPVPLSGQGHQIRATMNGSRQVAGSIDIRTAGAGKGFIANLKVDNEHRRRGVAGKLIDAAVATARRQGFSSVSLEARPSDSGITPNALVAMYRRQGFKSVGRTQRGNPLMERKL
ncbi:MAG TPA: N-acetyltransferase [Pyrinomonadaceae bacterium]|nr:N-acetyltransferase [Pyrinomonadaceae bacterium]